MVSTEILDHEHHEVLEEDQARRLQNERRFAVPGCPWDCWDGWHKIIFILQAAVLMNVINAGDFETKVVGLL